MENRAKSESDMRRRREDVEKVQSMLSKFTKGSDEVHRRGPLSGALLDACLMEPNIDQFKRLPADDNPEIPSSYCTRCNNMPSTVSIQKPEEALMPKMQNTSDIGRKRIHHQHSSTITDIKVFDRFS